MTTSANPPGYERRALDFAKALVLLYEDGGFDGIADEMTWRAHELANKVYDEVEEARAFIAAHSDDIGSPTPEVEP